jgi:UDP-3-O-[3-hydroxymyristoyl] glucosamine N-acyltransferase
MLKAKVEMQGGGALLPLVSPIRVLGDLNRPLTCARSLKDAKPGDLSYCNLHGEMAEKAIASSQASMIFSFDDVSDLETLSSSKCIVTVKNPRLAFIRCLNRYFTADVEWGVHSTAIIEKDVVLPKEVKIDSHVYIGRAVEVGERTVIEHRSFVGPKTRIGQNVYLQAGSIIGCEGQGFERNEEGVFEKFPQNGWVVLEDNVEIGANSTIVRGTFTETRIGEGSKIGHLTDIGHNVRIGRHVFISAGVVIAGSAIVDDYSWLAPGVTIRDGVRIGKNVRVLLGTVITKDIKDGQVLMGIPGRNQLKYLRMLRWLEKRSEA